MYKTALVCLSAVLGWKLVSNMGLSQVMDGYDQLQIDAGWAALGIVKEWVNRINTEA